MGRVYEKWHICKCLVFHAENLVKVYTQKNSGYTKSRRKIRQQKIPKINSKFLHIEVLSREAWASKDTRFLTLSFFAHPAFGKPADRAVRPPLEPRQSRHDPALLRRARRGGADPDRARRGPVRPGRRFLDDGLVLLRAGGPHVGQRLGFCVDRRAEGALPGLSGGGHDGAPRKDAFGSGLHKADDAADRQRDRGPAPHLQGAQRRARDDSDESARLGQFLQRGLRRHSHVLRSRAPTRGGNVPRRSRGGRVLRDSQILI